MAPASPVPDSVDVVIVGAGPVGLTTANLLGQYGVSVLVAEAREDLIDYPRGVGMDDETLRTFQTAGVVDAVLPHVVTNQIMRIVNGSGRILAELAPPQAEFGWPRRNGFIQPLVDRELYNGLARHSSVAVRFSTEVTGWQELPDHLLVSVRGDDGAERQVRAQYLVGADGGRSDTRHAMGVSFDGQSNSTRWLVVDLNNDPLGHPNSYLGADPRRPYVSIALPHGVRRFEFMLFSGESDDEAEKPEFVRKLMASLIPGASGAGSVDMIRARVYTHHSRIAGSFRKGRVLIAGDAAHLMPVWQGQGFNSGIRDASNLAWKLAMVVRGTAAPDLLDTYDAERRDHAQAMINLSTLFGRFVSPTNPVVARLRDGAAIALGAVPSAKAYVAGMKFKPMPRYTSGAIVPGATPDSPV
ncbi:MAG: bifunctional 3-(3-hydroxy-phenyl)propionate/3-hydroxycinnamic acid hydroxylase, partial [Zavarzinella sp.]|nr:bifunctional 3-(3-hydroxy-phenyl)propionate/3-hydroxycinnamic acid hydroxylase [Zavarzinella sp.]